jgi:SNF2 family DNA or RNA helicase
MPNHVKWEDRPGIELVVSELLKNISIRHKFEDCVDIPENHRYAVTFTLNKKHMSAYLKMEQDQMLLIKDTVINAVNGAAVYTKLLQIASGAVYNGDDSYTLLDTSRYEMIMDLVEERQHSIVFFNWEHQRDELVKEATKRSLNFAVYDGTTTSRDRTQIVKDYQEGNYRVLFAHPQSAGHGLTLTKWTATIWASPTYNLEHFLQGLKRIHRIGQNEKTETIVIVAAGTKDEVVWDVMNRKDAKQKDLLELLL